MIEIVDDKFWNPLHALSFHKPVIFITIHKPKIQWKMYSVVCVEHIATATD
jgi:hypothetical protein